MSIRQKFPIPRVLLLALAVAAMPACTAPRGLRGLAGFESKAFPDQIVLKTPTETFDLFRYYIVRNGRIFFKLIPPALRFMNPDPRSDVAKLELIAQAGENLNGWQLYGPEGLPFPPKGQEKTFVAPHAITEISADADQLVAISDDGRVYLKYAESQSITSDENWYDVWGWPEGPFILTPGQREHRALVAGRRNQYVLYSEDPAGTQHHYGNMGTTTLYFLSKNGEELRFTDSGLPSDLSHRICGPSRSTRRLENISASASAIMAIDSEGRIYTKMEDFDLNGGSAMFFDYTYKAPATVETNGSSIFSNWTPWKLPLDDWRTHAGPVLTGQASLSRRITILQTGQGNSARALRIGGTDQNGHQGFYTKMIDESTWRFIEYPVNLMPEEFLHPVSAELPPREYAFQGLLHTPDGGKFPIALMHFSFDCTPSMLRVTFPEGSADLTLHHVETWTGKLREDPGVDGTPKVYFATLELGQLAEPVRGRVNKLFGKYDLKPFAFTLAVTRDWAHFRSQGLFARFEADLERTSLDPLPPLPPSADNVNPLDKKALGFVGGDGYLRIANHEGLTFDRPLDSLDVADITALDEKIKANRDALVSLDRIHAYQKQRITRFKVEGNLIGAAGTVVRLLGAKFVPGIRSITKRGRALLISFADAGEWLSFHSEAAYRQARRILLARIAAYEARVKAIEQTAR